MPSITELRHRALTTGLNAVAPLYSKVAPKVADLAGSPVGRRIAETAERGLELVSPVVERIKPKAAEPAPKTSAKTVAPRKSAAPVRAKKVTAAKPATKKAPRKTPTKRKASGPRPAAAAPEVPPAVEAPEPTPVTPRTNAPELPLAGYDALLAEEIVGRLDTLDRAELQVLLAHERATDGRTTVIEAIEARLG